MSLILRHHTGTLPVPESLLTELENVLAVTDGPEDVATLAAIMARVAVIRAAGQNPELDEDLARDTFTIGGHPLLNPAELHAMHQLRATATSAADDATSSSAPSDPHGEGQVRVDAHWVSEVRNALAALTTSWDGGCDEFLEELRQEKLPANDPILVAVTTAVAAHTVCELCELCQFESLRERLDRALDEAGFDGGTYYRAYVQQIAA